MPDVSRAQFFDPKPYFPGGSGQGKLFADPKPTDEHRYPRGYTPERMAEVRGAGVIVNQASFAEHRGPHIGDDTAFVGHGYRQRVLDTIARSTTPASELVGKRSARLYVTTGSRGNRGGVTGFYEPDSIHITTEARTNVAKAPLGTRHENEIAAGRTLLHELGHHRSRLEGQPHESYDTPVRIGKEEAFADDNMVTRFRPDPRDIRAGRQIPDRVGYEDRGAFDGIGGKRAREAYAKARTTPIQSRQHGTAAEALVHQQRRFAETSLVNDQLFHRDYAAEEATGKPAWMTNDRYRSR